MQQINKLTKEQKEDTAQKTSSMQRETQSNVKQNKQTHKEDTL